MNDLDIYNFSSQTTILNNSQVQGNLNVVGEANGLMTFDSTGLQVNGVTYLDNANNPGSDPNGLRRRLPLMLVRSAATA